MITDSVFYENGKLKSYGKYDSVHQYWRLYGFYENGLIESTRKLSPIYFWDVDTSVIYHRNGKIAWIFPYSSNGLLNGKLIGYYQNGSIKRESFYYRGFRTGTWKGYYQNGIIKSNSHYEIKQKDSVFVFSMPSLEDDKNSFDKPSNILKYEPEYFSWGDFDSNDTIDSVRYGGPTQFTISTFVSMKTGKWKTFDSSGKQRSKRLTGFDTTFIVHKLVECYGLSFQKVTEIYEKCNSFEELAQLLQENDIYYTMTLFLRNWHDADENFLEALNEPRVALGLARLTFKEKSKGKIENH